jgi:Carboxypeptidase activation peptide
VWRFLLQGFKLISVAPLNKRQRKTVVRLAGKQGVQFWLAQRNATGNFVAQILVSPGAFARVTKRLKDKGVDFRVVIQDLQVRLYNCHFFLIYIIV